MKAGWSVFILHGYAEVSHSPLGGANPKPLHLLSSWHHLFLEPVGPWDGGVAVPSAVLEGRVCNELEQVPEMEIKGCKFYWGIWEQLRSRHKQYEFRSQAMHIRRILTADKTLAAAERIGISFLM